MSGDGPVHLAVSVLDESGVCGAPDTEWHTLRLSRDVTCRSCQNVARSSPDSGVSS